MAIEAGIAVESALAPGSVIDGFRIVEELSDGGTSRLFRVVRADGSDPGFPMVMKVPKVGPGQPAESILGYETEAMILPALHGPSVPRFVGSGDLARIPHLTMEWVQGQNLAAIAVNAPLPIADLTMIGAALADALHSLHRQNAIHHDLKPNNAMRIGTVADQVSQENITTGAARPSVCEAGLKSLQVAMNIAEQGYGH